MSDAESADDIDDAKSPTTSINGSRTAVSDSAIRPVPSASASRSRLSVEVPSETEGTFETKPTPDSNRASIASPDPERGSHGENSTDETSDEHETDSARERTSDATRGTTDAASERTADAAREETSDAAREGTADAPPRRPSNAAPAPEPRSGSVGSRIMENSGYAANVLILLVLILLVLVFGAVLGGNLCNSPSCSHRYTIDLNDLLFSSGEKNELYTRSVF